MNCSGMNTSQRQINKIDLPEYLEGGNLMKITLPSFLTQGVSKKETTYGLYNVLSYNNYDNYKTTYACGTTCEVTTQQCKECTTCQGCEDNCQHGSCESACMGYCEVNGECSSCLRVCQAICEDVYQCSCQSSECGYCESGECSSCEGGGQSCQHQNTEWTTWEQDSHVGTQCKRSLICKNCSTVIKTESSEHSFQSAGVYRFKDEAYHEEVGACSRCGAGLSRFERHNFVDGVCNKCGVFEGGGGGGLPPTITNFEAEPSPNGMSIKCSIVAKNATQYKFTLYDDSSSRLEISSSGMTSSSEWSFSTVPNMYYTVLGEAYNKFGAKDSSSTMVKTPSVKPAKFIWKNMPQTDEVFSKCVTSFEWERLQQTVNAWRSYYGLELYKFVQIPTGDDKFTVARTGEDFTYIYYNQIISGIKTIPKFKGTLPSKITSNPTKWMASDFIAFQDAVNYFLTI